MVVLYAKTTVVILIMMKVMISPQWFHPFERRIPCMDGIMHGSIHEVTQHKTGKEHKCTCAHQQVKYEKK